MAQSVLNALTLSNINRFSKFFHCQNQEEICNNIIKIHHTASVSLHYIAKCQQVMVSVGVSRMGNTASSSSSREQRLTANITVKLSTCSRWRSTTCHPCKMPALLLDPAAGRRTVTH